MTPDAFTEALPSVRFFPWVGMNYEEGWSNGNRLLILGESHYEDADVTGWLTDDLISGVTTGNITHRFFTIVAQLITGDSCVELDKHKFWSKVAFYNFVQVPLSGARVRPTWDEWLTGVQPFKDVVKLLQPEKIIVLGKQLWEVMPNDGIEGVDIVFGGKSATTYRYEMYINKTISCLSLPHPSSVGFSATQWQPHVAQFLRD